VGLPSIGRWDIRAAASQVDVLPLEEHAPDVTSPGTEPLVGLRGSVRADRRVPRSAGPSASPPTARVSVQPIHSVGARVRDFHVLTLLTHVEALHLQVLALLGMYMAAASCYPASQRWAVQHRSFGQIAMLTSQHHAPQRTGALSKVGVALCLRVPSQELVIANPLRPAVLRPCAPACVDAVGLLVRYSARDCNSIAVGASANHLVLRAVNLAAALVGAQLSEERAAHDGPNFEWEVELEYSHEYRAVLVEYGSASFSG
jgi:hypothetical protein